jgi:hypothetical protein
MENQNNFLLELRLEAKKKAFRELHQEFLDTEDYDSLKKLKKLTEQNNGNR